MKRSTSSFKEFNETYPCDNCEAPCCRYLLLPYKTPSTWMDLDLLKYILNFPNINVTVSKEGTWGILFNQDCIHLDVKNLKCKVHKTSMQPKTCTYFNPYECNYKLNFNDKNFSSMYILNREKFEHWLDFIKFNENGLIIEAPSFEKAIKILKDFEKKK